MSARGTPGYVYFPDQSLGAGATAAVYTGRHKKKGWTCAVKVYHTVNASEAKYRERELEVMKRLSHENIVQFIAIEQENVSSRYVLIMELCSGGSLLKILEKPENAYGFSEEEFLVFFRDITNALQYLHGQKIVHRDIKPGNILCHILEDSSCVYKLTDFGAAKELQHNDEPYASLVGTEEYLHPDVYRAALMPGGGGLGFRKGQFDSNMDLWSLGVTIYQVATGQLPFQSFGGRSNKDDMYLIISKKQQGVISGIQKTQGGEIIWSKSLPPTCRLSRGLKAPLVRMLDLLLESDPRRRWDFRKYFDEAQKIISALVICYFCVRTGREDRLYANRDEITSEAHLVDALAEITELPPSTQMYLHERFTPSELISARLSQSTGASSKNASTSSKQSSSSSKPGMPASKSGVISSKALGRSSLDMLTSPDSPLYIIPRQMASDALIDKNELPKLPAISIQQASLKEDVVMAREACAYVMYIKSCIAQLHRYQNHYIKLVQLLRNNLTQNWSEYCATVNAISFITESMQPLILSRNSKLLGDICNLKKDAASTLKSKSVLSFLSETTACTIDNRCINTVTTIVRNIEKTLQDFKQKGPDLSHNDEQIHRFEKKQMMDSAAKILSIYRDQCYQNTDVVLKQFQIWHRQFSDEMKMEERSMLVSKIQEGLQELFAQHHSLGSTPSPSHHSQKPPPHESGRKNTVDFQDGDLININIRDPRKADQALRATVVPHANVNVIGDSGFGSTDRGVHTEMDLSNQSWETSPQSSRNIANENESGYSDRSVNLQAVSNQNNEVSTSTLSNNPESQSRESSSNYSDQFAIKSPPPAARRTVANSDSSERCNHRSMPYSVNKTTTKSSRSLSAVTGVTDTLKLLTHGSLNFLEPNIPQEETVESTVADSVETLPANSGILPLNHSSNEMEKTFRDKNFYKFFTGKLQCLPNETTANANINTEDGNMLPELMPPELQLVGPDTFGTFSWRSTETAYDLNFPMDATNEPQSISEYTKTLWPNVAIPLSQEEEIIRKTKQRNDATDSDLAFPASNSVNFIREKEEVPNRATRSWSNVSPKELQELNITRQSLGLPNGQNIKTPPTLPENIPTGNLKSRNMVSNNSSAQSDFSKSDSVGERTAGRDKIENNCQATQSPIDLCHGPYGNVEEAVLTHTNLLSDKITVAPNKAVSLKARGLAEKSSSGAKTAMEFGKPDSPNFEPMGVTSIVQEIDMPKHLKSSGKLLPNKVLPNNHRNFNPSSVYGNKNRDNGMDYVDGNLQELLDATNEKCDPTKCQDHFLPEYDDIYSEGIIHYSDANELPVFPHLPNDDFDSEDWFNSGRISKQTVLPQAQVRFSTPCVVPQVNQQKLVIGRPSNAVIGSQCNPVPTGARPVKQDTCIKQTIPLKSESRTDNSRFNPVSTITANFRTDAVSSASKSFAGDCTNNDFSVDKNV